VVTKVEGVDGAGERTSEGAMGKPVSSEELLEVEGDGVLAHTPVILLATEETVEDDDWVAFRFALIIVETVRKINDLAARGRVEGTCPWYRRG
jgi:hypothetical protein